MSKQFVYAVLTVGGTMKKNYQGFCVYGTSGGAKRAATFPGETVVKIAVDSGEVIFTREATQ